MRGSRGIVVPCGVLLALVIAPWTSGCDAVPCRAGTLYLTLDFVGPALAADQLSFDVTVDGTHQHYVLGHAPGTRRDTLEVIFHQYPSHTSLLVEVTAASAGSVIGHARSEGALAPSCTALELALAADAASGSDSGSDPDDGAAPVPIDLATPLDLAGADLASSAMTPPDLAGADLAQSGTPVITLKDPESITPQFPNGNNFTAYNDGCPTDTAIIGFELQVATDGTGAPLSINRADAVCAGFVLVPKTSAPGGWTARWGTRQLLPGRGSSGDLSVEYLCPQDTWVYGFSGRQATNLVQLRTSCAPITVNPDRTGVNVGPAMDNATSVGGSGGNAFAAVYCPPWKVATFVRTDEQAGQPPDAFGLGCYQVTSH